MLVAGHLQVAVSSAAAARCSAVLGDATVVQPAELRGVAVGDGTC